MSLSIDNLSTFFFSNHIMMQMMRYGKQLKAGLESLSAEILPISTNSGFVPATGDDLSHVASRRTEKETKFTRQSRYVSFAIWSSIAIWEDFGAYTGDHILC